MLFLLLLLLVAYLLAKLEIEIEGKHGWAEKLPVSWRTTNKWAKCFGVTTSYHLHLNLFILAIIHLPFAVGLSWAVSIELMILSFMVFLQVIEDLLWFVFNPHYGIKKFNKEGISWHTEWLWKFPTWYYRQLVIGAVLYTTSKLIG